ncbi:MAG: bifunctional phosphoribosyl-AMP cyclohydrolase/phosphoribosyl-ATP diphosphatase HisIE [Crocinitomicaceae bacterium]|nr:bifunctional phosphoribosyl-AMP cyclohydrolase/phosphoribosyl-ATP diphosphatase HisIE [Crocinitomicaceae bacterium]
MKVNFNKSVDGLVPVIVQDNTTFQVLMLGYMNQEALEKTEVENRVTFYSRSKQRLWTKGEESGNFLNVVELRLDCDNDTILAKVNAEGPACHTGDKTCFKEDTPKGFLYELEQTIKQRVDEDDQDSYTNQLIKRGINKVAQKVGEEAVELVIEAKDNNDQLFKDEAADLLYHILVLLKAKNITLFEVEEILKNRRK